MDNNPELKFENSKPDIFIDRESKQVIISGTPNQLVNFYKKWKKDLPPDKEVKLNDLIRQGQEMYGSGQKMYIGKADDFCLDEKRYKSDEIVLVLVSNIDNFEDLIERNKNIL